MSNEDGPCERPIQVTRAVILLWVSLGFGLAIGALDWQHLASIQSPGFTIYIAVFGLAIMALLIYKISLGRNWARITVLVLMVFGALPYVSDLADMFRSSMFVGFLSLAQLGLQLFALYLIFTNPGKTWFRAKVAM